MPYASCSFSGFLSGLPFLSTGDIVIVQAEFDGQGLKSEISRSLKEIGLMAFTFYPHK